MTTDVDIANQALGLARARMKKLTSLSTPAGPEADQISLNYTSTRDQLLRAHFWNFAKTTVDLGPAIKTADQTATAWTSAQPPPPWQYEYAFPGQCLAVRYVIGQPTPGVVVPVLGVSGGGPTQAIYYDWEVVNDGGPAIVTNAPTALACITAQITDPSAWDIDFQQAMIAALAATITIPLSGDVKLAGALGQQANALLVQARVKAANESTDQQEIVPDWLRARWSGCETYWGVSIGGTIYAPL